jgi:hypothetical protein
VDLRPFNELSFYMTLVGLLGLPVAIGVAVLRYGLFELDLFVNRTLVYAALTVVPGRERTGNRCPEKAAAMYG